MHRREGFRTSKFAGGAVIAQVAFENRSGVFGHVEDEPEAVEIGFDGSLALLTVAGAALALAIRRPGSWLRSGLPSRRGRQRASTESRPVLQSLMALAARKGGEI